MEGQHPPNSENFLASLDDGQIVQPCLEALLVNLFSVLDGNLTFEAKLSPGEGPAHSSFHFFISQAVYERIQHGNHCCVEHCHHFIEIQRENCAWPHVDKDESLIQDGDSCEMGRACGEGSVPPTSRVDAQDRDEDAKIGD